MKHFFKHLMAVVLSLCCLPLFACGEDKDSTTVDPPIGKVDYTVNEEEWNNSFGLDKPFYFADNYKISMLGTNGTEVVGNESYSVDGNKVKDETFEGTSTKSHVEYYSLENDTYYVYREYSVWQKNDVPDNPMRYVIDEMLIPFLDMSSFTYDEATHTYKCATMSLKGGAIVMNNLTANFENKKAVKFTYDFQFHMEVNLVYGGQTVKLPEIES